MYVNCQTVFFSSSSMIRFCSHAAMTSMNRNTTNRNYLFNWIFVSFIDKTATWSVVTHYRVFFVVFIWRTAECNSNDCFLHLFSRFLICEIHLMTSNNCSLGQLTMFSGSFSLAFKSTTVSQNGKHNINNEKHFNFFCLFHFSFYFQSRIPFVCRFFLSFIS